MEDATYEDAASGSYSAETSTFLLRIALILQRTRPLTVRSFD